MGITELKYRAPQRAMLGHLANGAQVIAREGSCVLAMWEGGPRNADGSPGVEYVTWRVDAEGACYWGRYHTCVAEAAQDFVQRCAERS